MYIKEYARKLEKLIEQLQQENKKINGSIQTYNILLKANVEENKQLKDNWNKLKEWVKEQPIFNYLAPVDIKNKMQELERGVSDDNH